jgi:outer membrane protein OmpA-like peptidoglycan-associated protein
LGTVADRAADAIAESESVPDALRAVAVAGAAERHVDVLALQRTVGNAAVGRLARAGRLPAAPRPGGRRRTAPRTLARFIGPEHEQLGNEATGSQRVSIGGGITLTWGQIIALAGDQIGSIDELLAYGSHDPAKRRRLRAAFDKDDLKSVPPELTEAATEAETKAQDTEYLNLVMHNITHFPDAGKAIGEWSRHHDTALDKAIEAGVHGGTPDLAYAWEAFGEHFLTDCFSGGHIRTPRSTMLDWYRTCFAPRALQGLKATIVERLVSSLSPAAALAAGGLILASFVPRIDAELRELLALVGAGAVSGSIHDLEGERGVWVRSAAHPTAWKAYGDGKLNYTPGPKDDPNEHPEVNKQEAEKAIRRAKWEVDRAFELGRKMAAQWGAVSLAEWLAKTALPQDEVVRPYKQVLDFVPQPLPVGPGRNVALEEWRWGSITASLRPEIDKWIRGHAGPTLDTLPGKVPEILVIPDLPSPTILYPRALVQAMVDQLKRDPTKTLGDLIKWPAMPSLASPGNPAVAPGGNCAVPPVPPAPVPDPTHHVVTLPDEVLHFRFDSADVDPADEASVVAELEKEMGAGLTKADLSQPVQVRGYTDAIGADPYNLGLSQRRADTVTAILEKHYPRLKGHVDSRGLGATHFVAPNRRNGHDDPAGRRKNRRVEVEFRVDVVDPAPAP